MKKYKHKQTGSIATLVGSSGYKLDRSSLGLIPKEYVENTNDWEIYEAPKPLFTTEDGKEILLLITLLELGYLILILFL